jgi:membrane-associated phospholipid phosphatase
LTVTNLIRSFRNSDWVLIGYFVYVAALPPFFPDRPHLHFQPALIAATVFALQLALACGERTRIGSTVGMIRDWTPVLLALIAFQEMEIFLPRSFDHQFEAAWIRQDVRLLGEWHLRDAVEAFGPLIPAYLELCYLLVYGVAAYCVGLLYGTENRRSIDTFLTFYLAGTLSAYALFPFFPSEPPRLLYPAAVMPSLTTWVRVANLWILKKGTIHVGVFPSAHVSSAFSAAWGMFFVLPRKRVAWGLLLYACSVSLATIYGRYHYTADVLAGIGISILAGAICWWVLSRRMRTTP